MNRKKIEQLKIRYFELLADYALPMNLEQIKNVEERLGIILPNDFKEITKFFSGNPIGPFVPYNFFEFENIFNNVVVLNRYNIVYQTLFLRERLNLPHRFIALLGNEVGFMCMETQDDPTKDTPVIYCDLEDMDQIIKEKPLKYEHDYFANFTDFFEWLIKKEEELREEERQRDL